MPYVRELQPGPGAPPRKATCASRCITVMTPALPDTASTTLVRDIGFWLDP
jgi:hypothetical protein